MGFWFTLGVLAMRPWTWFGGFAGAMGFAIVFGLAIMFLWWLLGGILTGLAIGIVGLLNRPKENSVQTVVVTIIASIIGCLVGMMTIDPTLFNGDTPLQMLMVFFGAMGGATVAIFLMTK